MKSTNTTFATGRIIGLIKVIFVLFLFAQGIGVSYGQNIVISLEDQNSRSASGDTTFSDTTGNNSNNIEIVIEQSGSILNSTDPDAPIIINYYLYDDHNVLIQQSSLINQQSAQLPYLNPDAYLIIVNTDKGATSTRFNISP